MRKRCSVNIVSWLILWRPWQQGILAGLSQGVRRAMRALPLPCQGGCGPPLHPFCLRHGAPDQGGQA